MNEKLKYGRVVGKTVPKYEYRWKGSIVIEFENGEIKEYLIPGSTVQWIEVGDKIALKDNNEIFRIYGNDFIKIWPPFSKEHVLYKKDPLTGKNLYKYSLIVREATKKEDFYEIVQLEQYHYASKKEFVAVWYIPEEKRFVESNIPPSDKSILVEIKGSLPVSRFLILELKEKLPFEPRIVGYVRVDPPIPRMHRRIVENGNIVIEKNIREKIFPKNWFQPTYWPEALLKRILEEDKIKYSLKSGKNDSRSTGSTNKNEKRSLKEIYEKVKWLAIKKCNTSSARISRVVIHPDYRGDGLGMLAVKSALEWIKERRIPETRKEKHMVETIAQMARYNPFFEKVGFKYLFDTKSGRPYLAYALTETAKEYIENFLKKDKHASKHKGRLYLPRYNPSEPLKGSIKIKKLTKLYNTELDISGLPDDIKDVLIAFGVERRVVQRYVLKDIDLEIKPSEVVVVVGISGAGKTTLLRMLVGKALSINDEKYVPDHGEVILPENIKISALIPGEIEPEFGNNTILEHVYKKLGDIVASIEVLNYSGLSDAVFYRAKFSELSTGQKERAKIASMLAERPNIMIIDEFCAHLDTLTAQRVSRKLAKIVREKRITLIVVTHKPEIIDVLNPDKIIYVGYGGIKVEKYEKK